MEIIRLKSFKDSLYLIMEYISLDSLKRSFSFEVDLSKKIEFLSISPYMFRKSIYFNDNNIRDLIFKGYVIPYKIDEENNKIIIIGITKYKSKLN